MNFNELYRRKRKIKRPRTPEEKANIGRILKSAFMSALVGIFVGAIYIIIVNR